MGIYLEFVSGFPLLGFGATHIAPPSLSPGKTATTLPIRSLSAPNTGDMEQVVAALPGDSEQGTKYPFKLPPFLSPGASCKHQFHTSPIRNLYRDSNKIPAMG